MIKLNLLQTKSYKSLNLKRWMRKKRGQVTIFIIIAILIVAAIVGFYIFRDKLKFNSPIPPYAEGVYSFTQDCVEEASEEAVYNIGQAGGYFSTSVLSTDSGIPYYFYNNQIEMPSKEQIENEISSLLNQKLFLCTNNFADFKNLKIRQGYIKSAVVIKNDEVVIEVKYPIKIYKDEHSTLLEDFSIKVPVRLGVVYDSISKIVQEQSGEEGICLSCISDVALENDLYVNMYDYNNETIILNFRDENSVINELPFEFTFADNYN